MFRRRSIIPISTIGVIAAGLGATWLSVAAQDRDEPMALLWIEVGRGEPPAADKQQAASAGELEALRAGLAAAEQRLSAAVTAAKETEDRLAEEIARRAVLDAKATALSEDLAAAQKSVEAAEAKAERAVSELAKIEAVLPASRMVSPNLIAGPEASPPDNASGASGGETTASIDKSDSAPTASGTQKSETAASAKPGDGAQSADAAPSKPEPPKRTVRRKKKGKPKEEYFFDSLF